MIRGTRLTTKVAQGQTKPHISLDLQQHKCCHTTCILASWEINMLNWSWSNQK